nr:class I SAM-dependent methyltransferase [uncultured Desulfobulbus sp.]
MTPSTLIGAVALVLVLTAVVWRFSSRRHSLPCPVWLRWMVELDNPLARTNRAAFIVDTLSLAPGMTVLDAGCGPGRLTLPLAKRVGPEGTVTAVDLQPGMLERVRAKAERAGLGNIKLVRAGLGEGQLPRGHFERAVLVTVLGEIPDRDAALAELYAALKPGGILAVAEIIFDPHFQTKKTVLGLAAAAGFGERTFWGNRMAYLLHFEKPER